MILILVVMNMMIWMIVMMRIHELWAVMLRFREDQSKSSAQCSQAFAVTLHTN